MDYYVVDPLTCMFCMHEHSCISLFLVALKLTACHIDANVYRHTQYTEESFEAPTIALK